MSSWCLRFSIRRLLLHENYTTLTRSFCSGSVRKRKVVMSKQERAQAVNSFVEQYMLQFPGKFPSSRLVRKEVGGTWDAVRQAIAELKISLKTSQDRKQNADVNEGALEAAESVAPENLSTKSNDATLMEINGLKQKAHSSFDKISEIDLPVNQKPILSHSIEKGSITQSFSDGSLLPMLSEKLHVENTAYEEDCSIAPTCPRGLSRTNLFDNQGKTSLPSSNNKWKQEITLEKVENNACNEGYSSFVHSKGLSSTDIELQNMELDKARGGIPVPASTDTDELAVKNNTNKEVNCYNANKEANYSAITSKKSELFASSTPKKMVSKQSTEVRSTWHAQGVTLSPKVENKHEERGSYAFKNAWSLERSAASSDINIELKNLEPGKVRGGIAVAASTDMDEIAVENNKNKEVNCSTITLKNLELDKLGGLCVAASTDLDEITVENKANKESNSSAITSNIRELLSSSTPAKWVSEQSTEVGSTWHVRGVTLSPKLENKQEERGSDVSENASLLGRSAAKAETNTRTRIPQQTKRPGQDQSNRRFPSTSAFLSHKDSDDEREDDSDFAAFDYPEPNRGDRPTIPRTNIRLNMPGFPEKPENLQCLLVMFLPCSATAHDLHMAFGDCGRITEVNIIQSRREENRFNYASIIFKTKEALQKALMKKDVVVSGGDVLVKVASSSNQNKCQDSAPRVVENIAVPLTKIKIPRCTVMIKDLPHGLSFKHLKDALAFFGTVSHFVMGSSNSIIYVEFETDDAKERALMAHWICVGGKELQIRRVESPRTPVVRISNVSSETGVTKILNVCKSFGRVKRLDRRDIDIVDVHFRQTELGSMLNILDSLNGVIMDQCHWHAQPAPVFSPETLQSLWSSADGKEYLHSVIQNLFRVINENCFDENDVHELAAQYFREQFSRTKQPVIPTV